MYGVSARSTSQIGEEVSCHMDPRFSRDSEAVLQEQVAKILTVNQVNGRRTVPWGVDLELVLVAADPGIAGRECARKEIGEPKAAQHGVDDRYIARQTCGTSEGWVRFGRFRARQLKGAL